MAELKDSGSRRDFGTGAVRDCAEGKGRCDLLPLGVIAKIYGQPETTDDLYLYAIGEYIRDGDIYHLQYACRHFMLQYDSIETAIMELSKQYEDGANKYADRNWENGIPLHCFIDSAIRHYLKFKRGDRDEPHDRAFMWNICGAIWTHENKPEMIDLPFKEKEATNE